MNTGKIFAGVIVISALAVGAAVYYLQVYAYYDKVSYSDDPAMQGATQIRLTSLATNEPEPILVEDFQGIDADSSPLRFRACFTTSQSQAMLTETYVTIEKPVPLNGPKWFDCYNAQDIGAALESGEAIAFLGENEIHDGVDRVVAVFPDGRAFVWHQLNDKYEE